MPSISRLSNSYKPRSKPTSSGMNKARSNKSPSKTSKVSSNINNYKAQKATSNKTSRIKNAKASLTTSSYKSPKVTSSSTYKTSKKSASKQQVAVSEPLVLKSATKTNSKNNLINNKNEVKNSNSSLRKRSSKPRTIHNQENTNRTSTIKSSLDDLRNRKQVRQTTHKQISDKAQSTLELPKGIATKFGRLDLYTKNSGTITTEEQADIAFNKWWDSQYRIDESNYNPNYSIQSVEGFQMKLMYMSSRGTDVSKLSEHELNKLFVEEAEFHFGATMAMFATAFGVLKNLGIVGKIVEGTSKTVVKSVDDVLDGATAGRVTKGKTTQYVKSGDFSRASNEFDSLNPSNVKNINTPYGQGKTGTLPDGRTVTVRPGSTDGRPTLEIRNPNGRGIEIRYGE